MPSSRSLEGWPSLRMRKFLVMPVVPELPGILGILAIEVQMIVSLGLELS